MRIFTAHTRQGAAPVLVREGFSWTAAILALIAGLILVPGPWGGALAVGLAWALGVFGRDLWRLCLGLRGYVLAEIVAAPDLDSARARLLDRRPDLLDAAMLQAMR